jgi:hypothetical protein
MEMDSTVNTLHTQMQGPRCKELELGTRKRGKRRLAGNGMEGAAQLCRQTYKEPLDPASRSQSPATRTTYGAARRALVGRGSGETEAAAHDLANPATPSASRRGRLELPGASRGKRASKCSDVEVGCVRQARREIRGESACQRGRGQLVRDHREAGARGRGAKRGDGDVALLY